MADIVLDKLTIQKGVDKYIIEKGGSGGKIYSLEQKRYILNANTETTTLEEAFNNIKINDRLTLSFDLTKERPVFYIKDFISADFNMPYLLNGTKADISQISGNLLDASFPYNYIVTNKTDYKKEIEIVSTENFVSKINFSNQVFNMVKSEPLKLSISMNGSLKCYIKKIALNDYFYVVAPLYNSNNTINFLYPNLFLREVNTNFDDHELLISQLSFSTMIFKENS